MAECDAPLKTRSKLLIPRDRPASAGPLADARGYNSASSLFLVGRRPMVTPLPVAALLHRRNLALCDNKSGPGSVIDVHSHILWDLDDGPRTLDESLAMLRVAAATGTTDIVATPHANSRFAFQPEAIEERLALLRESAGGLIGIHSGCDFHLHYDNIQDALAHPAKYTIAHRSYLLVEFAEMFVVRQIDVVAGKMLAAGIVPVITHPERNFALQQRIQELARWVSTGCLVQVTAQSLLGRFGSKSKRFAELLLKKNLVHIVASDAHDCTDRPASPGSRLHLRRGELQFGVSRAPFCRKPRKGVAGRAHRYRRGGLAGKNTGNQKNQAHREPRADEIEHAPG